MTAKHIAKYLATNLFVALGLLCTEKSWALGWERDISLGDFARVHIYLPAGTSPIGDGRSLLILLHGCLQDINDFANSNLESVADEYGMVIALPEAMNKAGLDCWSYWQGTRSRDAGDYKNLITLANILAQDAAYTIDKDQRYIAGLSSGATFAQTTACLAPDVFAGMGISAGPSIGTSALGALQQCEVADVRSRCLNYAGNYTSSLRTQIAVFAHGDSDRTVSQCYNRQNTDGMAAVYEVDKQPGHTLINGGPHPRAREELWENGRVAMLWLYNVEHAWSAGEGASGNFISDQSLNYAGYLAQYFTRNNQRARRNQPPTITRLASEVQQNTLRVFGETDDSDGDVQKVHARIVRLIETGEQHLRSDPNAEGTFDIALDASVPDAYFIQVQAEDERGAFSTTAENYLQTEVISDATHPFIIDPTVDVVGDCATVSAVVQDINQDLGGVELAINDQLLEMQREELRFVSQPCGISPGTARAEIVARDINGGESRVNLDLTIPPPIPCFEESGFNYYHKLSGRARSEGNPLAPTYFAIGSEMLMPWSTWGRTRLKSEDNHYWEVGECSD